MSDHGAALREVAALVSAALRYGHPATEAELYPVASRLGLGEGDGPVTAEVMLRRALGLPACRCAIAGTAEVLPFACPVHGSPCEYCGEIEGCAEGCGEAAGDPAGTLIDLRSGEPRTVFRDGDCLVIPALRLDAEGCALLRTIVNDTLPDLAGAGGAAP